MRLKDENGRMYSPAAFMEVARAYGLLYDALSMEMIRKVFDAFKDNENESVSINLGMRDIKNEELTRYICSFLSTARHPEHFIFEILENEDVDEYETLLRYDIEYSQGYLFSKPMPEIPGSGEKTKDR